MRLFLWRYAAGLHVAGATLTVVGVAAMLFAHVVAGAVATALGLATMAVTHDRAGA